MCLGFEITCSKYPHSSSPHKKSNGSFHICFPSLVIPGEALFVQHITVLLCCNCLGLQRATRLSFPCQHTCIFVEVKLTCLVVVFLLYHSSGRLSSGVDLLPSRPQQCACVSGRGMASAGTGWQQFKPWFLFCGRSCSAK